MGVFTYLIAIIVLLVIVLIFVAKRNHDLSKYLPIENIDKVVKEKEAEAKSIIERANTESYLIKSQANEYKRTTMEQQDKILSDTKKEQRDILSQARTKANEIAEKSNQSYLAAQREAKQIVDIAREHAQNIAGDAFAIKEKADYYSEVATAMSNKINGYGNEYIIPNRNAIDDLADEYSYSQAAADYKSIESQMNNLIKTRGAAVCSHWEISERNAAMDFCVDAFNGKLSSIMSKVRSTNYGILKQQLQDAFTLVAFSGNGFREVKISDAYYRLALEKLRLATVLYEMKEKEKEEQRAIREQMREEERARREIEKAIKDAAKQEDLLQKAMEKAREKYETANEEQKAKYESQLVELQEKLKEAEERNKRAQSMAELTKSGHVYIISNIGSFGENIYKIGMTRRLEPLDRVRELGDASVPFPFDVHAMVWSEDAPSLETALHKHFAINQVNKINFRKEFFNVPIKTIREEMENLGITDVSWTMLAEAREYRETMALEKQIANNPEMRDAWLARDVNRISGIERNSEPEKIRAESEVY